MERSDLLRDQAGLQKLHDQLQSEYEAVVKEKDAQKDVEKQLRSDLKKLQVKCPLKASADARTKAICGHLTKPRPKKGSQTP